MPFYAFLVGEERDGNYFYASAGTQHSRFTKLFGAC